MSRQRRWSTVAKEVGSHRGNASRKGVERGTWEDKRGGREGRGQRRASGRSVHDPQ